MEIVQEAKLPSLPSGYPDIKHGLPGEVVPVIVVAETVTEQADAVRVVGTSMRSPQTESGPASGTSPAASGESTGATLRLRTYSYNCMNENLNGNRFGFRWETGCRLPDEWPGAGRPSANRGQAATAC